MKRNRSLNENQKKVIATTVSVGLKIQGDFPQVVDLYKNDNSLNEIVSSLKLDSFYNTTKRVSKNGLLVALSGHAGGYGFDPFDGLISDEKERRRIGREHMSASGSKNYENGLGMYARNEDQIKLDNSKAGKIGGNKVFSQGLGFYGRTNEERREDVKKGSIAGVKARGCVHWTDDELQFAYELSLKQEYQLGTRTNNSLIAEELNQHKHNGKKVRTGRTVKNRLCTYRKVLEDKAE